MSFCSISHTLLKNKHLFENSNLALKANTSELTNVAKTTTENTFGAKQNLESGWMGVDNPALVIKARTDLNTYSRPAIYFECYGTSGASLFFDVDGKLKLKVSGTVYTINMN